MMFWENGKLVNLRKIPVSITRNYWKLKGKVLIGVRATMKLLL